MQTVTAQQTHHYCNCRPCQGTQYTFHNGNSRFSMFFAMGKFNALDWSINDTFTSAHCENFYCSYYDFGEYDNSLNSGISVDDIICIDCVPGRLRKYTTSRTIKDNNTDSILFNNMCCEYPHSDMTFEILTYPNTDMTSNTDMTFEIP